MLAPQAPIRLTIFIVDNGLIKHGYAEDNYRVGIRNIAKWYSEGLIDQDAFDRTGDVRKELLGSNRGGMTHDWFAVHCRVQQ